MPRAYWKGFLRLSLVTCPIELFPASSQAEKTHFHQINKKTGNRLRQQMVDEQTGKTVDRDQKGRGYEVSKGKYVEIEPEELEAVEIRARTRSTSTPLCRRRRSTSATTSVPTILPPIRRAVRRPLPSSAMQ